MNKNRFAQVFFMVLAANLVGFALGFASAEVFIVLLFVIPAELFLGLLLVFFKRHRHTGAALLAASGVMLLVAGFVCSSVSFK